MHLSFQLMATTAGLVNLADVSFNELMSQSGIQFVIPTWQRLYSWEDKQWEDLWDDLMNMYDRLQQGQTIEHFLGPIVVKTTEERVGQMSKRILIDGQQRLTTLTVLCALLRTIANGSKDNQLGDEIADSFIFNRYAKSPADRLKLSPTQADMKAFKIITDSQQLDQLWSTGSQLARAWDFFVDKLKEDGKKLTVASLLNCIKRLRIVTINLSPTDDPNRIFETLNSRGKELGQADLIRNYFMMAVKNDADAASLYDNLWFPMQERLGHDNDERIQNLEEFFRQQAIMTNRSFIKESDVYEKLKTRLRFVDEKGKVRELKTISDDSKLYERLLFPEREPNREISSRLARINRLEVGVSFPFLLKAYRLYASDSQKLSVKDFISILDAIESFAIRRLFHNAPTHSLNRFFASLCGLDDDVLPKQLRRTFASKQNWEAQYCPSDSEFEEDIAAFQIYKESSDRCRFILETLEERLAHPEPVELKGLSIEHVMPETLSEDWQHYLGPDWENIYTNHVNTLPNLTLIAPAKNSSIGNKSFDEKKAKWYNKSNVSLTKEITRDYSDWKEVDMVKRGKRLAKLAVEIWPRPE